MPKAGLLMGIYGTKTATVIRVNEDYGSKQRQDRKHFMHLLMFTTVLRMVIRPRKEVL